MLSAKGGLGLRALRATIYTDQDQTKVAENLKHGDWPAKKTQTPQRFSWAPHPWPPSNPGSRKPPLSHACEATPVRVGTREKRLQRVDHGRQ